MNNPTWILARHIPSPPNSISLSPKSSLLLNVLNYGRSISCIGPNDSGSPNSFENTQSKLKSDPYSSLLEKRRIMLPIMNCWSFVNVTYLWWEDRKRRGSFNALGLMDGRSERIMFMGRGIFGWVIKLGRQWMIYWGALRRAEASIEGRWGWGGW